MPYILSICNLVNYAPLKKQCNECNGCNRLASNKQKYHLRRAKISLMTS